jgi:hypothetical protein
LARLTALGELQLENVELADLPAWPGTHFSALRYLAELRVTCSTKPAQQAAARLLHASPASLRSLELRVDGNSDGGVEAALGRLTQLTRLAANTPAVAQHLKAVNDLRELQLSGSAVPVRLLVTASQRAGLCNVASAEPP